MRASVFYHKLHIVQLEILFKMTGISKFENMSKKWKKHLNQKPNKLKATLMKILFKIFYY